MILLVQLEEGGVRAEPVVVVPLRGSARSTEVDQVEVSLPQQAFSMRTRPVKPGDVIVWQGRHWEITGVQADIRQRTVVHTQEVPQATGLARYAFAFCDGALVYIDGRRMYVELEGAA